MARIPARRPGGWCGRAEAGIETSPTTARGRRVLIAWELGGGAGHINKLVPLADGLTAAGHDVVLAMRDPAATRRLSGDRGFRLLQAPILTHVPQVDVPFVSWADILLNSGYTGTDALRNLLAAWLAMFDQERPELIVTEFAPAAMLAARIHGLRVVCLGTGWTLPPSQVPMPSICPWSDIPPSMLAGAEARALGPLNAALVGFGGRPLAALADLFRDTTRFLCCFPELDHYAGRGEADYFGAIYETEAGIEPEWPAAAGPRIFAYVSNDDPLTRSAVEALGTLGWPAVIHCPEELSAPGEWIAAGNVWRAPGPVRLAGVLAERPVVLCQGLNTTAAALVAGSPVLLLPTHHEQAMLAHRVTSQGLGLTVPPRADATAIASLCRRLRDDPGINARVDGFAAAYHGYRPAMAVEAIVAEVVELLSG